MSEADEVERAKDDIWRDAYALGSESGYERGKREGREWAARVAEKHNHGHNASTCKLIASAIRRGEGE